MYTYDKSTPKQYTLDFKKFDMNNTKTKKVSGKIDFATFQTDFPKDKRTVILDSSVQKVGMAKVLYE